MSPKPSKSKVSEKLFHVNYCKYGREDLNSIDIESLKNQYSLEYDSSYNPFDIECLQLYNPVYKQFFDMNDTNFDKIALNHRYHIVNTDQVYDTLNKSILEKPVFIKYSPLLDPVRYMIGKYESHRTFINKMPGLTSDEKNHLGKMTSYNNASYVDCFFSYLTSGLLTHHKFLHGVDYYGSYLGVQNKYKFCATDDIEYLRNSDFFNDNHGKLFYIESDQLNGNDKDEFSQIIGSRGNKHKLNLLTPHNLSEISMTVLDSVENHTEDINTDSLESVYDKEISNEGEADSDSDDSDTSYSENNEESGSSEEWASDKDDDSSLQNLTSELEEELYGYIHQFPVQMICLEKCEGTLDELFVKDEIDVAMGASVLFQVIMMLLAYQKAFKFTHNDLHTNNIMWNKTDLEFLTYQFKGKVYKVPTYGKIFKLIDFGRAIYKFQDKQFCSDSFAPGGDAATQYNFEPFFNRSKPRLEPNYSFDLCRLGSSIFDFIMDVDLPSSKMDDLQKTVNRWCLDDNKKNVLYKKNGDERYPNFKLYKMIARTVHDHCPEAQLEFPYFKQFLTKGNVGEKVLMDLDELPTY